MIKRTETEEYGSRPALEDSIRIDSSEAALEERLELCRLRTENWQPGEIDPALTDFFTRALRMIAEKSGEALPREPEENPVEAEAMAEAVAEAESTDIRKKTEFPSAEAGQNTEELQRLERFWLRELEGLLPRGQGGRKEDLAAAWETTLQLLTAAEAARAEQAGIPEKEMKDIVYAWLYDYAEEFLDSFLLLAETGKAVPERFLTGFLTGSGKREQLEDGLALFFGNRLRAKLLELLSEGERAERLCRVSGGAGGLSCLPDLSCLPLAGQRRRSLREFLKKTAELGLLLLLSLALTACGGGKEEAEDETEPVETAAEADSGYPGTVAAADSGEAASEFYGVMHALVLDVQDGDKDGLFVYTLRDDEDPENAWSLNSQSVGEIFCEVTGGNRVAVLFHGDILNDPDAVEFIAILPDAEYKIKKAEGTTVSNMMNSFIIRTKKGTELTFIKDNCRVDRDALSTEAEGLVTVWYADCGSGELYPVRVLRDSSKQK